jgi:hypothetical protein
MASTYTSNGGIELIATGEQSGTWGTTTNTNLSIIDRLTNGVGAISLTGTSHTLTTTDGALSDGQYRVLVFGGTPSGTNTVTISPNDAQHLYFVKNGSGQSVVLSQGSGTTVTVADGKSAIVYADGGGAGANVVDLTSTFNFQPLTATLTAIGALAVTDGNVIVGNGSTWVAESGATARTSLGLGTGDSPTFTGVTTGQLDITAQGDLRLQDTTGGEYVALQAPGTVSASYTLTLPAADGTSGQFLSTDGSGALSFATGASLATPLAVVGNATAGSEIRLPEDTDNGSNYVALKAPDSIDSNRTLTVPNPGSDETLGFLNIPQNSQSAAYTLVISDAGKHILHPSADTTARTFTIPANGSVPFPVGTAVTFINQDGAGVITIAITTDTMRLAGAGTTGSRTLAANGIATAVKVTSTEWIISGTGLT